MMSKNIKKLIKALLGIKEDETVKDGLERKKSKIKRLFYRKKFSKDELMLSLQELGISSGDNIMVHCAYREFYNFMGGPTDVIELLLELVGPTGTVLMPCYGPDLYYFDVNNSKSAAGVVSEVFRNYTGVVRSECTNFSICACGMNADYFVMEHKKSCYGFDEYSPYYRFSKSDDSKIIMLGLGKRPVKNTIFHFAGYFLKDSLPIFNNLLSYHYSAILVDRNGLTIKKDMISRGNEVRNSSRGMKRVFDLIPENNRAYRRLSNLDIVVYDAKKAIEVAMEAAKQGIVIYKGLRK